MRNKYPKLREERAMRAGKALAVLPAGDKRRLSDARNAWRKMTDEQRVEFLTWLATGSAEADVPWPKLLGPRLAKHNPLVTCWEREMRS